MRSWCLLAVSAFVFASAPSHGETIVKHLADGVTLTQEIDSSPPLIINVLTIDPSRPGVKLEAAIGQGTITGPTGDITKGRGDVLAMADRDHALAAVNSDYFP